MSAVRQITFPRTLWKMLRTIVVIQHMINKENIVSLPGVTRRNIVIYQTVTRVTRHTFSVTK